MELKIKLSESINFNVSSWEIFYYSMPQKVKKSALDLPSNTLTVGITNKLFIMKSNIKKKTEKNGRNRQNYYTNT